MFDIDESIKYLQDFDRCPEYQSSLNCLIKSFHASVDIKNDLRRYLKQLINQTAQIIAESPNIGTVKDNSKLGMKMAYEDVLRKLETLEKLADRD